MNTYTELIERYLQNTMNAAEREAFEFELKTNAALREELAAQKILMQGIERNAMRQDIRHSVKQFLIKKLLLKIGIVIAIAGTVAAGIYAYSRPDEPTPLPATKPTIADTLITPQTFEINTDKDTVIETNAGIIFGIPAHAFKNNNGDIVSGNIKIQIREALNAADIIKSGLSTMSDDKLLETAGMFSVEANQDSNRLSIAKPLSAHIPASEIKPGIQLFDGTVNPDGSINWVNPKPLSKSLRTYDILSLDFYPKNYLPTLQRLGLNHKIKQYTDSLYYSFSGYCDENHVDEGDIDKMQLAEPVMQNYATGEINVWDAASNTLRNFKDLEAYQDFYQPSSPEPQEEYQEKVTDTIASEPRKECEIDPSRIKAIWDRQYNNTLLATKEFEERLKFIFSTCNSRYLDCYVNNLNKPMYIADSLCATMTSGATKEQFLTYYHRKDGGVQIADMLQQKLSTYFTNKQNAYRDAAEKTWRNYFEAERAKDAAAQQKRSAWQLREEAQKSTIYEEERQKNLLDAYRQLGISKTTTAPAKAYYNVPVASTGWKNLDQYVTQATASRSSMYYKDPFTGKTATLTYENLSVTITDAASFERLMVYLIPDSLSSFQRMKGSNGIFSEKLNKLFRYDLIAVGYKGGQAYYHQTRHISPGTRTLQLQVTDDGTLDKILNAYQSQKQQDIMADLQYQQFELGEAQRLKKRLKDQELRNAILPSVFPCMRRGEAPPSSSKIDMKAVLVTPRQ